MMMPELRPALPLRAIAALALSVSACSHSDAFTPADPATDQPLASSPPIRLTYNPLADLTPSWFPDGSAFIYSFGEGFSQLQGDQCLGIMSPTGGTRRRICNAGAFADDSTDTFSSPAVSAGDQLAYVRASKPLRAQDDRYVALVYGPLNDPAHFATVRTFPFQSGSTFYTSAQSLTWLGETRLALLGTLDTSIQCADPPVCNINLLIRSGRDILLADLTGGTASISAVPGTSWATSVARGSSDDEIFYTVAGSSQVFRLSLSGGSPELAHDFLARGIARDVSVAGNRLAAVVGGAVTVYDDGAGDPIQQDGAGHLVIVDLVSGTEQELTPPLTLVRHPTLAPDGSSIVAEVYRAVFNGVDNVAVGSPDLVQFPLQ
jgi:Tol biopolymer transport system component